MARSKYKAIKTVVDGVTFDSEKEASRYKELKMLEHAGVIKNLDLQPKFTLQESFKHEGKTHRSISYVADFMYLDLEKGCTVVEDVKGHKTQVYNIKKKLFLKRYGDRYKFIET